VATERCIASATIPQATAKRILRVVVVISSALLACQRVPMTVTIVTLDRQNTLAQIAAPIDVLLGHHR
jgi:hypothetical protein